MLEENLKIIFFDFEIIGRKFHLVSNVLKENFKITFFDLKIIGKKFQIVNIKKYFMMESFQMVRNLSYISFKSRKN